MSYPGIVIDRTAVFPSALARLDAERRAYNRILQGDLVYLRSDNTWRTVDPQQAAWGSDPAQVKAIACNAAWPGQPLTVALEDDAFIIGGPILAGETYTAIAHYPGSLVANTASDPTDFRIVAGLARDTTTLSLILKSTGALSA